jgi:hypothetical protein
LTVAPQVFEGRAWLWVLIFFSAKSEALKPAEKSAVQKNNVARELAPAGLRSGPLFF